MVVSILKSWSMTCMIKGNVNPGLINPVYGRLIGRLQLKHQMIHDWRRNPPFINQGLLLRGSHYAHDFGIHVPVGHQPLELQGAMPIHDGGAGGTSSVSLWPRGLDKGGGEKGLDKLGKIHVETLLKFILNNWKTSVISMEKSDNVHSSWKLWNFYGNSFHILNDNFGHFEMETCFCLPGKFNGSMLWCVGFQ